MFDRLLAAGVDIDATDAYGKTALTIALQGNYADAARRLSEFGDDVSKGDEVEGKSCFMLLPKTVSINSSGRKNEADNKKEGQVKRRK